MPDAPRKPLFPNPFYFVTLVASTAFVITCLAYFVSPWVGQKAAANPGAGPGPGSLALAAWFDRNGTLALGIEFAVMLVFSVLAMVTDQKVAAKSESRKGGRDSR